MTLWITKDNPVRLTAPKGVGMSKEAALGHLRILLRDAERLYNHEGIRDFDATLVLAKQALEKLKLDR